MNDNELRAIRTTTLSIPARLLYTAAIAPFAQNSYYVVDFAFLQSFLILDPQNPPNSTTINGYIIELINIGLLTPLDPPQYDNYCDGMNMQLALADSPKITNFAMYHMTLDWQPNSQFEQTANRCGLYNASFTRNELNDFVVYWSGRDRMCDNHGWNMAFIKYLKRSRKIY